MVKGSGTQMENRFTLLIIDHGMQKFNIVENVDDTVHNEKITKAQQQPKDIRCFVTHHGLQEAVDELLERGYEETNDDLLP
jgi:hypothetical protein